MTRGLHAGWRKFGISFPQVSVGHTLDPGFTMPISDFDSRPLTGPPPLYKNVPAPDQKIEFVSPQAITKQQPVLGPVCDPAVDPQRQTLERMQVAHAPYRTVQSLRKMALFNTRKPAAHNQGQHQDRQPERGVQSYSTLYERIEQIFSIHSKSSLALAQMGLLHKFVGENSQLTFAVSPSGSVVATLDTIDGFRRTLVFHSNGTSFQRVLSPNGNELARFSSDESLQAGS